MPRPVRTHWPPQVTNNPIELSDEARTRLLEWLGLAPGTPRAENALARCEIVVALGAPLRDTAQSAPTPGEQVAALNDLSHAVARLVRALKGTNASAASLLRLLPNLDLATRTRLWLADEPKGGVWHLDDPAASAAGEDACPTWVDKVNGLRTLDTELKALAKLVDKARRRPSPLHHKDRVAGRAAWAAQALGAYDYSATRASQRRKKNRAEFVRELGLPAGFDFNGFADSQFNRWLDSLVEQVADGWTLG